jgi:uncharacterized membrane protein
MSDFISQYFIDPMLNGNGYNTVNTSVYAIGFVIVVLFTLKLFQKMKIKIDGSFFKGLVPFIFLGAVVRSLEDAGVVHSLIFVTPGVYFFIYFIVIGSICLSIFMENRIKKPYWILMASMGTVMLLCSLAFVKIVYVQPLLYVAAFTAIFILVLFGIRRLVKTKFLNNINSGIIVAHLFDASTTFTALELSKNWNMAYFEQHVIAGFLMGNLGNYAIFFLKLAVIPVALWIIDTSVEDKQTNYFLKIAIFILGVGPGLRNLLSMMMGV